MPSARMSRFVFVPNGDAGNICLACQTHSCPDGFVDLQAEDAIGRALRICASCLYQASIPVGCLDPKEAAALEARTERAEIRAAELEDELAEEKGNKYVALAEVIDLVKERQARRPKAAGAA